MTKANVSRFAKTILIVLLVIVGGCATTASKYDEVISKALTPPDGKALIYIIRAAGHKGDALPLSFVFNQEEIGSLWSEHYLYVFANPMDMLVPAIDGSVKRISITANETYYFLYGYEMGVLDSFVHPGDFWSEPAHFRYLSESEARPLINKYSLSGSFRRVTIGSSGVLSLQNNASDRQEKRAGNSCETIYESATKRGSVTVTGYSNWRADAISAIKDICKIKNVALSTGSSVDQTHGSFLSLSEVKTGNTLTMKFECLY